MGKSIIKCKGSYSKISSVSIVALFVLMVTLSAVTLFGTQMEAGETFDCSSEMKIYESAYFNERYIFEQGDTVYFETTGLDDTKQYKIEWENPDGDIISSHTYGGVNLIQENLNLLSPHTNCGSWEITCYYLGCSTERTIRFNVYDSDALLLDAVADTYVSEVNQFINYNDENLSVGYEQDCRELISFLKFNISDLSENALILKANLHLDQYCSDNAPNDICVCDVFNETWSEEILTWNNKPILGDQISYTNVGADTGGYIWDITSQICAEYDNYDDLVSLVLKQKYCDSPLNNWFYDREKAVGLRPYLEIVYAYDIEKVVGNPNVPEETQPDPDYWVTTSTPITASLVDDSGKYDIWYKMWNVSTGEEESDVSWQWWFDETTSCVPIYFDGSCEHKLNIKATDNCGHAIYDNETFYVDITSPHQTVEFGNPRMPSDFNYDGEWLTLISDHTPVWLNSTDEGCMGGVGTCYMTYEIWWKENWGDDWTEVQGTTTVNDNNDPTGGDFDEDPTPGQISVTINVYETGFYEIHKRCYDCLGNSEIEDKKFLVDATGPDVWKYIDTPQCEGGDYITSSTPIWFTTSDPGPHWTSGVKQINYTIDGVIQSPLQPGESFNFCSECLRHIEFWAIDNFDNEGPHYSQSHCVDDTSPETTIDYGDPYCYNSGNYITSHTSINLSAVDYPQCCSVDQNVIYYRVWTDSTGDWTSWMTYKGEFTMDDLGNPWNNDCKHYIEYYAVDCLGNTESINNRTFYVDNTPPQVTKDVGQPMHTRGGKQFVTTDTILWLNATDVGTCQSDTVILHWSVSPDDVKILYSDDDQVKFRFDKTCKHTLEYWAEDCLGNTVYYNPIDYYVDGEEPVTDSYYGPPSYEKNNVVYISEETIKHIFVDDRGCNVGGAGSREVEWSVEDENFDIMASGTIVDNDPCCGYNDGTVIVTVDDDYIEGNISFTIQVTEECRHYIIHKAMDYLGNWGPRIKQEVRIDTQPPTVDKTYPKGSDDPFVKCSIRLTGVDHPTQYCTSGVQYVFWRYLYNDDTYPCCSEAEVFDGQDLKVDYRCTNPDIYNYCWYYSAVNPKDVCFDDCMHDIYYFAVDNVWNFGQIYSQTDYIDCTPPTVEKTFDGPFCTEDDIHYWVKSDTSINLTAYEERDISLCQSGIESFNILIWCDSDNDGVYETNVENIYFDGNPYHYWYNFTFGDFCCGCSYKLVWNAKDNVTNENIKKEYYKVDDGAPGIFKAANGPHMYDEETDTWLVWTETEINITAFDYPEFCASGVVTLEYRIWNNGHWRLWKDYVGNFTFSESCVHYLEIKAIDCLGNMHLDNETFFVHGDGGQGGGSEDGPFIEIVTPQSNSTQNDDVLEVKIYAYDKDGMTSWDDLDVKLFIPGGRRDAPTMWSGDAHGEISEVTLDYVEGQDYYHAYVELYKYQNGTEITLWAMATDDAGNGAFSTPVPFTIESSTIWDQWMQHGWNDLDLVEICGDGSVEAVLISIDGLYDMVFDAETNNFWVPDYSTIAEMEIGNLYWVHIDDINGERFYLEGCSAPANTPPEAVNDGYMCYCEDTLDVSEENGVLSNDVDIDDDSLTATLVSDVSDGTLTLYSDGSFTYVPHMVCSEDYVTFTYQAYDGTDYSNIATVVISFGEPS